jgi:asparagine synthase (glutamine-hydrolysing)
MLADQIEKYLPLFVLNDFPSFARDFASLWRNPSELMKTEFVESSSRYSNIDNPRDVSNCAGKLAYADLMEYLPYDILAKVDRTAMAVSLETRAPLLDHRVVDFASSLPMHLKLRNGRGKWLLRELLKKYVPNDMIDRPKRGFAAPIAPWLRGPLREWASDLLSANRLFNEGIFDANIVQSHWQEHLNGQRDWSRKIWPILMYQQWSETLALDKMAN